MIDGSVTDYRDSTTGCYILVSLLFAGIAAWIYIFVTIVQ